MLFDGLENCIDKVEIEWSLLRCRAVRAKNASQAKSGSED